MRTKWMFRGIFFLACAGAQTGNSIDGLPYSLRTHSYNAYPSSVRGDIHMLGLAGATVGLGDTILSSLDNPAGVASTIQDLQAIATFNNVRDGFVQNFDETMGSTDFGIAQEVYPWGWSLSYLASLQEGQEYYVSGFPTDPVNLELNTHEFRAGIARVFLQDRVSLGLTLRLAQAEEDMQFASNPPSDASAAGYAVSASFGALVRFKYRLLLGVSYSLPMHFAIDTASFPSVGVTNFFQPIDIPNTLGVGAGWIPNRFFRAGFTLLWIGTTPNAALLSNDAVSVGSTPTLQPRLGASYKFVEFKELRANLSAGTYLEASRIQNEPTRLHATFGLEVNPWVFYLGLGRDESDQYQNYLFTFGIDIVRTLEKLDAIPKMWRPPNGGWLPKPFAASEEGLPRPLVENWHPHGAPINPISVAEQIPKKLEEKVVHTIDTISPPSRKRKRRDAVKGRRKSTPSKKAGKVEEQ